MREYNGRPLDEIDEVLKRHPILQTMPLVLAAFVSTTATRAQITDVFQDKNTPAPNQAVMPDQPVIVRRRENDITEFMRIVENQRDDFLNVGSTESTRSKKGKASYGPRSQNLHGRKDRGPRQKGVYYLY